jgi:hypothetical protein
MSFIWRNQQAEKENWEKITNVQNQTFTLPPNRYVIHLVKDKNKTQITTQQINRINTLVADIYTLRYAPEPLARLTSHIQIMTSNTVKNALWISLTNTSSRIARPNIIQRILHILNQYKLSQTYIYEGTEQMPFRTYNTDDTPSLMTVLMQTEENMRHLQLQNQQPPWTFQTTVQMTHIRNPVRTTPSLFTENTPTTTGEVTESAPQKQTSPHSQSLIMATTSTSSFPRDTDRTTKEQSPVYFPDFKHTLQELQRLI